MKTSCILRHIVSCFIVLTFPASVLATEMAAPEIIQTHALKSLILSELVTGKTRAGKPDKKLFSLNVEEHLTNTRRRVWQREFLMLFPSDQPTSFIFASTESEHMICFGFVRAYDVSVFLVDLNASLEALEQKPRAITKGESRAYTLEEIRAHSGGIGLPDLLEGDELSSQLGQYGVTIEQLAYSSERGWSLTLNIQDIQLSVRGKLDGEKVTWEVAR